MHYPGLKVIIGKEFAEHLRSKRLSIILVIVFIIGISSIYSSSQGIQEAINQDTTTDFVFLKLFTTSGDSLPSFASFMAFLGPLIGLALGFDAINGEMNKGTLSRLMAQPIYRDSIIIGKFLGGVLILSLVTFTLFTVVGALSIIMMGIPPSSEELLRSVIYLILTLLYMALWFAISLMFSMVLKQTATSALAGIALWLFMVIFISLLSGIVANTLFPVDDQATFQQILNHETTQLYLNRISPMNIYSEAMTTILNPSVRSVGFVFATQLEGAISGVLPVGQSLLLIWAHIVTLFAMMMLCFAITYIYFMKREVRA